MRERQKTKDERRKPYPPFVQPEPIRRAWAFRLAIALVLLGAILNLNALWNTASFGLVDDEAHYYLWSQHLDYGYYSKPPGIAWVMRVAELIGQTAGIPHATTPVLRTAAVLFSIFTGLLSIALARRIFRDDRAALMVTVLSAAVPMFVVGAQLITIDSPMYLCWAAAVYCLWRVIEPPIENQINTAKHSSMLWLILAGVATGIGLLFKPVLIAVPISAVIAAFFHRDIRRRLFSRHGLIALLIALSSQVLVLIWNANHGWVTLHHLFGQAGIKGGEGSVSLWGFPNRMLMYVVGQAGGMGGVMFVLLCIAVVIAFRARGVVAESSPGGSPVPRDASIAFTFLLSFTLPLWFFYLLLNFLTATQINWPAASYFTGMILLAGIGSGFWADTTARDHRAWKGWIVGTVIWGLLAATAIENLQWFYPMAQRHLAAISIQDAAYEKSPWHPRKWDPALRLREPEPRAVAVQGQIAAMTAATGKRPTLVAVRYNIASSLSFYLPGRPFVYCIGPWVGARQSQYDIWPGLNEMDAAGRLVHAGEDVLLIGDIGTADEPVLASAFARVEPPEMVPVMYMGINLRSIRIQRCFGFRGLPVTSATRTY